MKAKYLLLILSIISLTGCGKSNENAQSQQNDLAKETIQKDAIIYNENMQEAEEKFNVEDIGKTFVSDNFEYTVLEDGTALLSSYSGNGIDGVLRIPENIGGYTISQIGSESIDGEKLTELIIPGSVKIINQYAIWGGNIKTLVLEEGVEFIQSDAFFMMNLTDISLPNSLRYVGVNLMNCMESIESFDCYDGIYYIDNIACGFDRNKSEWSEINFKDGVRGISGRAFYNTNGGSHTDGVKFPNEITIPDSVRFIGPETFLGRDEIDKIYIPNSVSKIGNAAIGYRVINSSYLQMGTKIYGYEKSEAERYANDNNIEFITLR